MLKPAFLYRDQLNAEYQKHLYSDDFKYLVEDVWDFEISVDSHDESRLQQISQSDSGQILAYFSAQINRKLYKVDALEAIVFHNNLTSSRDLKTFIQNLTGKFGFRKVNFETICGGPGERVFDKHCQDPSWNCRIVGIKKNEVRLTDGKLYDVKLYEILPG